MIAVVDSGVANLASVLHALERLGVHAELTADPTVILNAEKVLFPGVGAAPRAMELLRERGLIDCLRQRTRPVLGICLGMQLLFERSEEGPVDTLNLLRGEVRRFESKPGLTIPQMGWNQVERSPARDSKLLNGIPNGAHFYFVHSYCARPGPSTVATCEYGERFAAVVEQGPWMGVQFHPERSGPAGARLLQNFLELS